MPEADRQQRLRARLARSLRQRSQRRKRVLVVDDDAELAEVMASMVRLEGCEPTVARDGLAAVQMLSAGPKPDLILLDMHMDGFDGWDLRAELDDMGLSTPIVVVTGDENPHECAATIGAIAYLAKPFDFAELRRTIHQAIEPGLT
jgi:CheY-like chemotaxis protein